MSITSVISRMAMAGKLTVDQLRQSIQSGSLPAYIGIPMIEEKNKEKEQMAAAQQGFPEEQQSPSVTAQILQKAEQQEFPEEQESLGIDRLPSNLPTERDEEMGMAGGGIVAFAGDSGSLVRSEPQYSSEPVDDPEYQSSIEVPKGALSGWFRNHMEKIRKQNEESAAARGQPIATLPKVVVDSGPTIPIRTDDMDITRDTGIPGGALPDKGINNLPAAKTAPPGTPGAPRPASTANIPLTTDEMRSQVASGKGSALDQYADMLMKERGSSAKDRQQAKGMAIFQAGLGIAGGTSPNAFANIAQGSLPAIQAYQQELKGLRAEDRDRIKQLMELGMGKEKLAMELRKLGIEDKKVNALVNLYNSKAAGSGAGSKLSFLEQKQYEAMGLKSRQEVTKIQNAMNRALGEDQTYKAYQLQLGKPDLDPKKRVEFQTYVDNKIKPFLDQLKDAREYASLYSKPPTGSNASGKEDVDLNQFFK